MGMFAKACLCYSERPIAFMMMFPAILLWLHVQVLGVLCYGWFGGLTLLALAPLYIFDVFVREDLIALFFRLISCYLFGFILFITVL